MMTPTTPRMRSATVAVALTILGVAVAPLIAAPFTPGNVIVAVVPRIAGLQPITLREYTPTGTLVQSYTIPSSAPTPFGGADGTSNTSPQINFGDASNQLLYVSTRYTNSTSFSAGYVRVNASGASIVTDEASAITTASPDMRGVDQAECRVFATANPGAYRRLGNPWETYITSGNNRWSEVIGNDWFISTGSTGQAGSTGLIKTSALGTPPGSYSQVVISVASGQPLGFYVADPDTIYLGVTFGGPFGLWKFRWNGSIFQSQGINAAIGATEVRDVDGEVDGSGNVTLYACTLSGIVYKINDTLSSTGAAWTGTAATSIVTGLADPWSVKVVPPVPAPPPSYTITTSTTGLGSGSVSRDNPGPNYVKCSTVQLTATADPGSIFVEWTGNIPESPASANPLNVVVDNDKNITARFDPLAGNSVLTLNGVGNGTINVSPPGVDYNSPGGPYNIVQMTGTTLFLFANPASGWIFDRWSGDVTPGDEFFDSIAIQLTANKTVTAHFLPLRRVRTFVTGNGTQGIPTPAPDGILGPNSYQYRQGTQVTFTATAGTIPTPASPWTLEEFHDQNNVQLATSSPFTSAPLTGDLDVTARFAETPNSATSQPFGEGNIVIATIRDFAFPGETNLREYNAAGELVQPVIRVPTAGDPSGEPSDVTSTTIFDINFDTVVTNRLYIANSNINDASPLRMGFIRTVFQGGTHVFDLARGVQAFELARGVAGNGSDVYISGGFGIRRYDTSADSFSTVTFTNTRMVDITNGVLYASTASTTQPYSTVGDGNDGPGIYRVDNPTGTPSFTRIISTPNNTALNAFSSPLMFKVADARNIYACFVTGNGYQNVHKFWFNGTNWVNQGNLGLIGAQFGRGVDVKIAPNNIDVNVYLHTTTTVSEGALYVVADKLDNSGPAWNTLSPTKLVPAVSRGRALAVVPPFVPTCSTCPGDVSNDNSVDGRDIQAFVECVLIGAGSNCACADMDNSSTVDASDVGPFVNKLLFDHPTACP